MLRYMKILLILGVAVWATVGALHNFLHWEGTLSSVRSATSMSTFAGGSESWQATGNLALAWLGALFIVSGKLFSAGYCYAGVAAMYRARHANRDTFQQAKQRAVTGCAIALFMLFFGFIVVAETWYEMWRSELLRVIALQSAFRYGGMIALVALFVAQPEPEAP